jgi:hypothetical protein
LWSLAAGSTLLKVNFLFIALEMHWCLGNFISTFQEMMKMSLQFSCIFVAPWITRDVIDSYYILINYRRIFWHATSEAKFQNPIYHYTIYTCRHGHGIIYPRGCLRLGF